jgi:hypothetical protein
MYFFIVKSIAELLFTYKLFKVIDNGILSESGSRCEVVVDNLALRVGDGEPNVSPISST